jgi:hypothetical protein
MPVESCIPIIPSANLEKSLRLWIDGLEFSTSSENAQGRGAKGPQHRSAGRGSNRAKPEEFQRKVLQLIRKKYSGMEQERFGPTLAAEHLIA